MWLFLADRGQGVLSSLSRALPELNDEQTALVTAFEKIASGRAPENRGNGLKFVRSVIEGGERRGIACRSGSAVVDYGALGPECRAGLARIPSGPAGTVTLVAWKIP